MKAKEEIGKYVGAILSTTVVTEECSRRLEVMSVLSPQSEECYMAMVYKVGSDGGAGGELFPKTDPEAYHKAEAEGRTILAELNSYT